MLSTPEFAVAVEGVSYGFHHSPLGLPEANAFWLPPPVAPWPCEDGVCLYQAQSGAGWQRIRWPRDLWWTRFLLTAYAVHRGTRYEPIAELQATGRFLAWWLTTFDRVERDAFFRVPDVPAVVQAARLRVPSMRGSWGPGHNLLRLYRSLQRSHPYVLRPCAEEGSHALLAYTGQRAALAVRHMMRPPSSSAAQPISTHTTPPGYGISWSDLGDLLLRPENDWIGVQPFTRCRWHGARLDEAVDASRGVLVPRPFQSDAPAVHRCTVVRYRSMGCIQSSFRAERGKEVCLHHF